MRSTLQNKYVLLEFSAFVGAVIAGIVIVVAVAGVALFLLLVLICKRRYLFVLFIFILHARNQKVFERGSKLFELMRGARIQTPSGSSLAHRRNAI